jgi:hypothetical protein
MKLRGPSLAVQCGSDQDSNRLAICGSVCMTWSTSLVPRPESKSANLGQELQYVQRGALFSRSTCQQVVDFIDGDELRFARLSCRIRRARVRQRENP